MYTPPSDSPCLIQSITVEGFKCFEQLELDNLAMINVFVGDNNSGKTSALHACRLGVKVRERIQQKWITWLNTSYPNPVQGSQLEESRVHLSKEQFRSLAYPQLEESLAALPKEQYESLLHHRRKNTVSTDEKMEDSFMISSKVGDVDCATRFVLNQGLLQKIICHGEFVHPQMQTFSLELDLIAPKTETFFFEGFLGSSIEPYDQLIKHYVVDFMKHRRIAKELMSYLHSIEPNIVDIKTAEDTLMFGFKGQRFRKDLNEMGEGFRKVVAIYMALVLSNRTAFFLDEIENGLSLHSQKMVWKMLFAFTQRGVRFFISTHQLQTLQTLQEAYHEFCDDPQRLVDTVSYDDIRPRDCPLEPLALYRLGKDPDTRRVKVKRFSTKLLATLVRAGLEVRYPYE